MQWTLCIVRDKSNIQRRQYEGTSNTKYNTLAFSCLRTLSMKKDQQFSRVSCWPVALTSFLNPLMMVSSSSPEVKRKGTLCAHIHIQI